MGWDDELGKSLGGGGRGCFGGNVRECVGGARVRGGFGS